MNCRYEIKDGKRICPEHGEIVLYRISRMGIPSPWGKAFKAMPRNDQYDDCEVTEEEIKSHI